MLAKKYASISDKTKLAKTGGYALINPGDKRRKGRLDSESNDYGAYRNLLEKNILELPGAEGDDPFR